MPRAREFDLSVIVIVFNMRREAPRTLYSLSPVYQRDIEAGDYEVIVIDNGSTEPLVEEDVEACGANFRYLYHQTRSPSPVDAVNRGVSLSRSETVMICLDGARILSPGLLAYALGAGRAMAPGPAFVATLAWHLGPDIQALSTKAGYGKAAEDRLLSGIDWRRDGYELFTVATLAPSSGAGWLSTPAESNCFALPKAEYERLGGLDARFQSPGGGLANLDFFRRALASDRLAYVMLLGEGTFHQIHGGASTKAPYQAWDAFHDEYLSLRGEPYSKPAKAPIYFGSMPTQCLRFLRLPVEPAGLEGSRAGPGPEAGTRTAGVQK
jgi:glycosyltransferase involved in cell wall biosynthesis